MIIFISQKIYSLRRVDRDLSVLQCLRKLFLSRSQDPFVISQMPNIESRLSHGIDVGNEHEESFEDHACVTKPCEEVPGTYAENSGGLENNRSLSGGDNMSDNNTSGTQDEQQMGSIFSFSSISGHSSRLSDMLSFASRGISSTGMSNKTEEQLS
jgi:hypothetical protein